MSLDKHHGQHAADIKRLTIRIQSGATPVLLCCCVRTKKPRHYTAVRNRSIV